MIPRHVSEMPEDVVELEAIKVAEWPPPPEGQCTPTQVHLLLAVPGHPEMRYELRFQDPDTLAYLINALAEHGRNVFGKDLARQIKRYA
jgi:hypothetical protein